MLFQCAFNKNSMGWMCGVRVCLWCSTNESSNFVLARWTIVMHCIALHCTKLITKKFIAYLLIDAFSLTYKRIFLTVMSCHEHTVKSNQHQYQNQTTLMPMYAIQFCYFSRDSDSQKKYTYSTIVCSDSVRCDLCNANSNQFLGINLLLPVTKFNVRFLLSDFVRTAVQSIKVLRIVCVHSKRSLTRVRSSMINILAKHLV